MKDQSYFDRVAGVGVVLVLVVAALLFVLPSSGSSPTRSSGPGPSGATVYRNLSITYDPAAGVYSYSVTQLAIPLHTRVVFVITNFDPSTATVPTRSDAKVAGIEGNLAVVTTGAGSASVGQIPTSEVSHTFSMSNRFFQVNVPIPAAVGPSSPVRVTFSAVFDSPGTFSWGCVVLCGSPDMHGPDSMYGSMTIS